jgi:hypothetical protein
MQQVPVLFHSEREGSIARFGKGGLRRKFLSEQGGKPQEYFVYSKV